jgi:hypothetical protein
MQIGDQGGNVCYAGVIHATGRNSEAFTVCLYLFTWGFDQYHTLVTSLVESGRSVSILFFIDSEEKVSH